MRVRCILRDKCEHVACQHANEHDARSDIGNSRASPQVAKPCTCWGNCGILKRPARCIRHGDTPKETRTKAT